MFPDSRIAAVSFFILENQKAATRRPRPRGNQKGFTLVELLVAILLLTVGIFAVIAMQTTSMNANSIAMRLSVASSLAQEALEDILSRPADTPDFRTSSIYDYDLDPTTDGKSITLQGGGTYSATYETIVGQAAGVPQGITQIIVTVTGGGRTVSVSGFKRTN